MPDPAAKPKRTFGEILESVGHLQKRAHAGDALVLAALTEGALEQLLATKMPGISSKTLHKKIFKGYGPLSTFEAKIDIAFALGLMTIKTKHDLDIVRDVRNKFAHAEQNIDFESPKVVELCQRFDTYDRAAAATDYHELYLNKVQSAVRALADAFPDDDSVNSGARSGEAAAEPLTEK